MPRRSARARQSPRPFWQLSALKNSNKENDDSPTAAAMTKKKSAKTSKSKVNASKATKAKKKPQAPASAMKKPTKRKALPAREAAPETKKHTKVYQSPAVAATRKASSASMPSPSPMRYNTNSFLQEMKSLMNKTLQRMENTIAPTDTSSSHGESASEIQRRYDELLELRETQPEQELATALDTISRLRAEITELKAQISTSGSNDVIRHSGEASATQESESKHLAKVYRRVCGIKMEVAEGPADDSGRSSILCTHIYKPTQTAVRYRLAGKWAETSSDSTMITFTPVGNAHLLPDSLQAEIEFKRKQAPMLTSLITSALAQH